MNLWVVKARLHKEGGSEGWHWENYFDGGSEAGKEWGGEDWIRSNESKKYIREEVRKGDLVVCFQSDNAVILGFTKMTTDGREEIRGSGEFNLLNYSSPNNAFGLPLPLKLQRLRDEGCNPKCFAPGRQGTIFPLELEEFQVILSTIVKDFPGKKKDLARWLKSVGYSLREKLKE